MGGSNDQNHVCFVLMLWQCIYYGDRCLLQLSFGNTLIRDTAMRRVKSTAHQDNIPTLSAVRLHNAVGAVLGWLPSTASQEPYSCKHGIQGYSITAQIARFMGPTWGLPGADRTQVGPMWATWALLSGCIFNNNDKSNPITQTYMPATLTRKIQRKPENMELPCMVTHIMVTYAHCENKTLKVIKYAYARCCYIDYATLNINHLQTTQNKTIYIHIFKSTNVLGCEGDNFLSPTAIKQTFVHL